MNCTSGTVNEWRKHREGLNNKEEEEEACVLVQNMGGEKAGTHVHTGEVTLQSKSSERVSFNHNLKIQTKRLRFPDTKLILIIVVEVCHFPYRDVTLCTRRYMQGV